MFDGAVPAFSEMTSLTTVLPDLLEMLPVHCIGFLSAVRKDVFRGVDALQRRTLCRRGFNPCWTWRKAQAFETALFCDSLANPGTWTPGPNDQSSPSNTMETEGQLDQAEPWLWLSGGTDWKGFQGGFQTISADGVRPTWVTFRVRIATPELSGAFLTLASTQHTWGLADPVLSFSYCGDERLHERRCFAVIAGNVKSQAQVNASRKSLVGPEIESDKPYDVAVWFDWYAEKMSVFVNGAQQIDRMPFKADQPIRHAAIYNWRSGARTAFSELLFGETCPFSLPTSIVPCRSSRRDWRCPSRRRSLRLQADLSRLFVKAALSSSVVILLTALAAQQLTATAFAS